MECKQIEVASQKKKGVKNHTLGLCGIFLVEMV
jgi:hypothetical protein